MCVGVSSCLNQYGVKTPCVEWKNPVWIFCWARSSTGVSGVPDFLISRQGCSCASCPQQLKQSTGSGVAPGSGHWLMAKGHMDTASSQCDTKAAQNCCEAQEVSRANRCQRRRKSGAQLDLGAVGEARAPYHLTASLGNWVQHSFLQKDCRTGWPGALKLMKHHEVSRIVSKKQGSSKIFYVWHQFQLGLKLHSARASGSGPGFAALWGSISSCSPHSSANAKEGFCCCNNCHIADLLKTCWMAWRQRTFLYCWQCWACS